MILRLPGSQEGSAGEAQCCSSGIFLSPRRPGHREGLLVSGLVSGRPFSSACVGDAVHCPLHVGLVLSIAQDQALLPAR